MKSRGSGIAMLVMIPLKWLKKDLKILEGHRVYQKIPFRKLIEFENDKDSCNIYITLYFIMCNDQILSILAYFINC